MSSAPLYQQCEAKMKELAALSGAMGLLGWDQETMMPPKGAGPRAEQLAALAGVIHSQATDQKLGDLLRNLSAQQRELTDDQQANVREWRRDYEKATKIPAELAKALAKTASLAQRQWAEARKRSDFKLFSPWFEKMVQLKRQQADVLRSAGQTRYDALLDNYEPNLTMRELDPIFQQVRSGLVPLVAAIQASKKKIDLSCLKKRFAEEAQEKLCREIIAKMGFDSAASRLDRSVHPFCGGTAPTDVRITTRYSERWLPSSLYGAMHEAGHGLYEQGFEEKYFGTPLAEPISLGIHESQSRLWENVIGRSRPFTAFLFPRLKKYFPQQLKACKADAFYRAVNGVRPSFIRVEADEVTYNLHIILRYEIERDLIEGKITVKEVPALWKTKMKEYLGIVPQSDAAGALQDVHWSAGLYGYFPTYTLGNLYSVQWWEKLAAELGRVEAKIAKGELGPIREWLRANIHRHGRRYKAGELVKRVTGKPLRAEPFLSYLQKKYGEIYGL